MKLTEGIAGLLYNRDKNIIRTERDYEEYQEYKAREAALELMKSRMQRENTAGQNSFIPDSARISAQRRASGYKPVTGSVIGRPGRSSLWSDPNELHGTLMAAAAERSRSEYDLASSKVAGILAENTSRRAMERERDRLAVNAFDLSDEQIARLDELDRLLADTRDIGTRVADARIERGRAFTAMGSEEARAIQKKVLDAKVSGPSRGNSLLDNQQARSSVADWWGRTADRKKAAEDETAREQALSYDEVLAEIKKLDDEIANSGIQKKQNDLMVSSFGMDEDAVKKSKELDSVNQEISELYQRRQHYAELLYQKKAERELSKIDPERLNHIYSLYDSKYPDFSGRNGTGAGWKSAGDLYAELKDSGADADFLLEYFMSDTFKKEQEKRRAEAAQFAKDSPVLASMGSVPLNLAEGVTGTLSLAGQKAINAFRPAGDYRPIDAPLSVSRTIRGTIGERLENDLDESRIFGQDTGSFLYNTGMSMADSALSTAASAGIGSGLGLSGDALKSFAGKASTAIISASAVPSAYEDAKARGLNDNQAFSLAILSGIIEAATEKYSVDTLLSEPKSVVGYILKNTLTEASEETVSEVANKITDIMISKDKSEWNTRIRELMEDGMSESEATARAFYEASQDVLASGFGGALSGGAMGGAGLAGHAAASYVRERASEIQPHQAIMQAAQERAAAELARDATPTMREFVEQEAARELEAEQEASVVPMQEEGLHRVPGQVDTAPQEALTGRETQEDTGVEGSDKPPRGDAQGATVQSKGEASAPVSRDTDTQGLYARKDRVLRAGASGKGKSVTVYGIESVSADDAVLRTSGGNQMKLSEAKFSDPAVQALYREAAGYDMRGANAFLRHYSGNLPVGTYKRSFDYFYRAGQMGLPYQTAAKNVSVTVQVLGKDAVQAAYNTGAAAAKADLALRKKAEVSQMPQGSFTDSSGYAPQAIAEISRLASKKLGVDIEYVPTLNGGNGQYLTGRAKILIAADSGNDFATLMHELGEHIKAQNPEGADAVARSLVGWYASREGYSTAGDLIEHYQKTYEKAEGGKTFRDAMDELSFDMLGGLFGTEEGLREFLTYLNTDRSMSADEKKNVLQRIADALRRVISEIREMLRDPSLSKAAREALQMEREQAQAMRRMVLDALDRATDNLKGAEKSTATDGNGEVKRSVAVDSDGPYVMVNVDQDIFDGLSTKEMREQARKYILEAFRGKVFPVGDDSAAFVNRQSAKEYANPANRRMAENLKQAKMRASTELDHLLKVSQFLRHENDDGRHADATGGWDVYRTRFMVGTEMFTGEVKIKLTDRGRLFYDVTKIERTARNTRSNQENLAAASGSSSYDTTITSSDGNVNSQYMQKSSEDSGEVRRSIGGIGAQTADMTGLEAAKEMDSRPTITEIRAVQSIGRKSINDFDGADIAATSRFATKYWREMGMKSPFFRAWFGDWRENDKTPVRIATVQDGSRGVQRNEDTGWEITISGKVFNESQHKGSSNQRALPYLQYINDIVKKAILLDSYALGKAKSANSILMHSLYAVADMGSGPELLKLYVEEIFDPNQRETIKRSYQLQNIERQQTKVQGSQKKVSPIIRSAGIHTVSDLFEAVKRMDANFNPNPSSKVVDEDGKPLVVYHGTASRFTEFKPSELRGREGSFFFAQNREDAQAYAGKDGTVMEVYVNIRNPVDYENLPDHLRYIYHLPDKKSQVDELKRLGYDGWISDLDSGWGEISAFYPEQIKSATENIGTFDPGNPDIRYSLPTDEAPSRKQLLRENEKLKQALSELREQFKLSKGHRLSEKSIKRIATRVLIDSSSSMKNGELAPKLRTLFDSIANGDPVWDDLVESSRVIASEVVEQSRNNRQLTEEAKEAIREIRSMPVSLSEEQKNETAYHYGSYGAFRKMNFGRLNISDKKGVPLESRWLELAEIHPEIFDPETSAPDMPVRLAEIMDTLQDSYESDYGFSKEDAITDLTYRILDGYWNVPEVYTYADKNKKKIDALKAKQRKRVQELRQELKDKYKKALAEQRQVSRERISKLRQENRERLDKQMARFQMQKSKSRAKRLETAEKQRLRRQITKRVQWLNNLLRHETDQKHIPEGMKRYVADLLKCFTESSPAFSSDSWIKAQEAYRKIRSAPQIAGFYDEDIEGTIGSLAAAINGKKLTDINPGELKDIRNIVDHIAHIVKSENEIFLNGKRQMVAGLGEEAIEHLDRHSRSKLGKKADDVRALSAFNGLLNSRLLKPVYFFRQVGGPLRELYQEVRNGENTWARHMQEARERFLEAAKTAGYASWVKQKPLEVPIAGRKIKMTVGQAMSIYALSRREQGLSHLLGGGIVLRDTKTMKESTGESSSIALDLEAISAIVNELSDEQIKFVEDLQGYLSSDVAEWGNDTSMQLFGIRKFTEETYFPIMSESNYLYTGLGGVTNDQRIKHTSFTKRTLPDAITPVSILDFQAVWANHVDRMALYDALALPLENFNRVYNYRGDITEDGEKSVKASLETAYGKKACSYIQHLIEDVNGGVQVRKGGELSSYLIRAFKKNAVMLSASVVIQQPSAIGRALAEIDPKYFATRPAGKGLSDEMKRYAPVAFIKELGRFDTNTGAGIVDYLTGVDYSGKGEKMKALVLDSKYRDDVFSWAPQKADELTWVYIWQAVKNETAHKNPSMDTKSEEFLRECGRRFEEVVDLTQVYDSVFSRSEMERSENGLEKMATAFMAEPITSYNLLRYGMIQGAHGDRKYMMRAIGAYAVSMTINSLLKALVQSGRDDDDTYGYWEKYIGNVIGNMIDDPLSMIPYVKDVISIFNGYDVERSDMALIADVVDWLKTLFLDGDAEIHDKLQALFSAAGALTGVPMKNVWRDGEMLYRAFDTILNQKDAGVNGAGIRDSILENLPRFFGVDIGTEGDRAYAALLDGNMDYFARMIKGKTGDQVDNMLRKALKENEPRVLEGAKDWANADTKAYMSMLEDVRADLIPLYRKRPGLGEEKDASRAALNDVRSSMVTLGDKLRKLRDAGQDIGRFSSYEEAQRAIKAFEDGEKEEDSGGDTEDKGALTTKQVIYNLDDGDIEEARSTIQEIIDFKSRDENGVATQKSRAKARSSVKSGLTSHYKPLYQDGDESEKRRIRTMLTQLNGLYSHEDITKWNQRD